MKVSQLKPTSGYILVEPTKKQEKTASGIILPSDESEKPQHGKVLACGDSMFDDGQEIVCPVKKNDQVVYKKWGGNEVMIDETEYQFLKFEDILAVINKEI
jgi:chaperonin GroES